MRGRTVVLTATLAAIVATNFARAQSPGGRRDVQQGIAEVNGTKLYYEIAGAGAPVALIHGNFGDRRHWDAQFETFARTFRVMRYDVRGFGKSAVPVEGQRYAHHEDLAALMRHLGFENAHIVGLSMGSYIATDFVLTHPEMSRSLVAIAPWVSGYQSSSDEVKAMFAAFSAVGKAFAGGNPEAAINAWSNSPYWRKTTPDTAVRARVRAIGRDHRFWEFVHEDPAVPVQPRTVTQVSRIAVPTLILTAEHDASREVADFLERSIPNARKVVMQGAGHFMQMDRPAEFNRIVTAFLREVDAARPNRERSNHTTDDHGR
ncbi:MAG TPA: alpha/beta hydrolase [Longimicrobiales bacterium]|nr:alpha/beta hydrolase [Longimicrobiales bacterium]